jgi:ketosteroid isomerase-like protein
MKHWILILLFSALFGRVFSQKIVGNAKAGKEIMANIQQFSADYVAGNYAAVAKAYSEDGKIFPPDADIIAGQPAIEQRWELPDGYRVLSHRISPVEIVIDGRMAYDHGYYEGETQTPEGERKPFYGKYVIVWKKVKGEWKIYLDCWNRVKVSAS